jgi:hypothetical protein
MLVKRKTVGPRAAAHGIVIGLELQWCASRVRDADADALSDMPVVVRPGRFVMGKACDRAGVSGLTRA